MKVILNLNDSYIPREWKSYIDLEFDAEEMPSKEGWVLTWHDDRQQIILYVSGKEQFICL